MKCYAAFVSVAGALTRKDTLHDGTQYKSLLFVENSLPPSIAGYKVCISAGVEAA